MSLDYDVPFLNESGEIVPAHAVMEVQGTDGILDADGKKHIRVAQRVSSGSGVFLLNGPVEVAVGARGIGTNGWLALALYDDGGTPKAGDEWGAEAGSWKLAQSGAGWTIVGDIGDETVRVERAGGGEGGGVSQDNGFAIVSGDIEPMVNSIDGTTGLDFPTGFLTFGEGLGYPIAPKSGSFLQDENPHWRIWESRGIDYTAYEIALAGAEDPLWIYLHNATGSVLRQGKIVQWWRVGDYRFVMAEDCS